MDFLLALLWVIFILAMTLRSERKKQAKKRILTFQPEPMAGGEDEGDPWSPVEPPAESPEGFGGEDAEGCVGGSMEHTRHEGESRREHRRHMAAALRREQEDRAREEARNTANVNVKRLREAVVMAEILDKPVALRRRGNGR